MCPCSVARPITPDSHSGDPGSNPGRGTFFFAGRTFVSRGTAISHLHYQIPLIVPHALLPSSVMAAVSVDDGYVVARDRDTNRTLFMRELADLRLDGVDSIILHYAVSPRTISVEKIQIEVSESRSDRFTQEQYNPKTCVALNGLVYQLIPFDSSEGQRSVSNICSRLERQLQALVHRDNGISFVSKEDMLRVIEYLRIQETFAMNEDDVRGILALYTLETTDRFTGGISIRELLRSYDINDVQSRRALWMLARDHPHAVVLTPRQVPIAIGSHRREAIEYLVGMQMGSLEQYPPEKYVRVLRLADTLKPFCTHAQSLGAICASIERASPQVQRLDGRNVVSLASLRNILHALKTDEHRYHLTSDNIEAITALYGLPVIRRSVEGWLPFYRFLEEKGITDEQPLFHRAENYFVQHHPEYMALSYMHHLLIRTDDLDTFVPLLDIWLSANSHSQEPAAHKVESDRRANSTERPVAESIDPTIQELLDLRNRSRGSTNFNTIFPNGPTRVPIMPSHNLLALDESAVRAIRASCEGGSVHSCEIIARPIDAAELAQRSPGYAGKMGTLREIINAERDPRDYRTSAATVRSHPSPSSPRSRRSTSPSPHDDGQPLSYYRTIVEGSVQLGHEGFKDTVTLNILDTLIYRHYRLHAPRAVVRELVRYTNDLLALRAQHCNDARQLETAFTAAREKFLAAHPQYR